MYQGIINTHMKRQPISLGMPWIRSYSMTCSILVFNEGFISIRADYWKDMAAMAFRNVHHGGLVAVALEHMRNYKDPEDLFGHPTREITPDLIRSLAKYEKVILVPTEGTKARIWRDSLFSKRGPYALAIATDDDLSGKTMLRHVHILDSSPTDAAQLLRRVLPESALNIQITE